MPLKRLLPAQVNLNDFNFPVASGMQEPITGLSLSGGLVLGDYVDLTDAEALLYSNLAVGTLRAGRYRLVQIEAGATQANIAIGRVGYMRTKALGLNIVTSADRGLGQASVAGRSGLRPVIFLNAGTPGNYVWVQELGLASVKMKAGITNGAPLVGDILLVDATTGVGLIDDPVQVAATNVTYFVLNNIIGIAIDAPASGALILAQLEFLTFQG